MLETEARAILDLIPRLGADFERAVDVLYRCPGRVIVTGMGKSGIIARKIAATLSSTGTPAMFLHAAEAVHGDLGVIQRDDVVVALSYSGETEELVRLLEALKRLGARLITLTGVPGSTLGQAADVALNCAVAEEACPMNLAPTASTTATLAMGDALAMALSRRKGFGVEDFADLHPGGPLGRRGRQLKRIETLMHTGEHLPKVPPDAAVPEVVREITRKRLGMTCVVSAAGQLEGVVTDGDLRRYMTEQSNLLERQAADIMTRHPVTIARQMLAVEALRLMEERKITAVVVVDPDGHVEGVVHLHDLWRTQMI